MDGRDLWSLRQDGAMVRETTCPPQISSWRQRSYGESSLPHLSPIGWWLLLFACVVCLFVVFVVLACAESWQRLMLRIQALRCAMRGHVDHLQLEAHRMCLVCRGCHRATPGWDLSLPQLPMTSDRGLSTKARVLSSPQERQQA